MNAEAIKITMKTRTKHPYTTLAMTATLVLGALSLPGYAADTVSANVGVGIGVAPAYEGSAHYVAQPVYDLNGHYDSQDWGEFSLGLTQGARWQLPLSSPVGLAVLMDYDRGRDERIGTLGGHNTQLRGMGDLGGALEAGLELSYQLTPFKVYVKGLQATRERHYGGESLGYTAHVDMGVSGDYPITDQLTLTGNMYTTWANGGYQRGYFGVTPLQASRSGFTAYHLGAGVKSMSLEAALNYQWTPSVAFQTGVEVSRLMGDAADSPLVEKALGGMAFVSTSYHF